MCHQSRISSVELLSDVIGGWEILPRKQSTLLKPKESTERHQTLSSWVGSGDKTKKQSRECHNPSSSGMGTMPTSMLPVEQLHCSVRITVSVPFKLYQYFIASSPSLE